MSRVALFPSTDPDRLWERYAVLARAIMSDQTKLIDRDHMQAMARAHDEWRAAFLASERRA
ncbi:MULTISPECIES: hypothetical protein [unclassified Sphingomonas]|uniref:hypothetical protein n=1 Tax=unclassified Sphingomonas TaxID=196159 RepID=UPI0006F6EF4D|nr:MULTISPECIES: hypothetical protein [unclassified Sphingomonas]KQX18398.1 hypothetical protein ASD17_14650 [Sphingomonas sp. Root1294]KQY72277.1 hypothetical protein ASD39_20325 [Sphingomonas sp. Root50]KRB94452.1 hypothetical protein ASE22_00425 [Sphingomonas sp. Root720]